MQRPSTQQIIRELERELAKRNEVYPRWIREGKITDGTANHRQASSLTEPAPLSSHLHTVPSRSTSSRSTSHYPPCALHESRWLAKTPADRRPATLFAPSATGHGRPLPIRLPACASSPDAWVVP